MRTLSFTKSAAILNISQPAVSKHIKELEAEIGQPLFIRGGNRIIPTTKAIEITPLAQSILDGYVELTNSTIQDTKTFQGSLHIGASTTIAQYVLPPILAKFSSQFPNIKLKITSANSNEIIEKLTKNEVEIALIESSEQNSAVHYRHLADDNIILVITKRQSSPLKLSQLTEIPLVVREEGSGTLEVILKELKKKGITRKSLNIVMQLGSSEGILRYLAASNAYAFLSVRVAEDFVNRAILHQVHVDSLTIKREFRFATLHGDSGKISSLFQDFCLSNL